MNKHKRFIKARQLPDEIAPPPAMAGISGEATLGSNVVQTDAFAFDSSATPDAVAQTAPPLAGTFIPEVTTLPQSVSETPSSDPSAVPVSAAGHTIPMSTVIGACLGAFAGACLIIIGGYMFYRRSTRLMMVKVRQQRKEAWNKLDDDEDKWDSGMAELNDSKVSVSRTPTEKLGVFKKSPSMRTNRTDKSDVPSFESQTFAPYHPKLALELAGVTTLETTSEQTNSRAESQVLSWGGGVLKSLRSERDNTSGTISPSHTMAIPTPIAVTSPGSHHWESAEVVTMDEAASIGVQESRPRSSVNGEDPFFDPRDQEYMARAKENSKGKQKEGNPFDDNAQVDTLAPQSHPDTAIQSLIAALGVSDQDSINTTPFSPPYSNTTHQREDSVAISDVHRS